MGKNTKINSYIYTIKLGGWGQVVVNEKSEKKAREIVRNYNPIKNMRDIDDWDIGVKSIERTDELIHHIDTIGIENETGETYLSFCLSCGTTFDTRLTKGCPLCSDSPKNNHS